MAIREVQEKLSIRLFPLVMLCPFKHNSPILIDLIFQVLHKIGLWLTLLS